jgi:chemotaxis family two-component system sensor kinase Cph1
VTISGETPGVPTAHLSARELAAEYAAGTTFDVSSCVAEPIHLLGGIQSHGALVAIAESDSVVRVVSENVAAVLGVEASELRDRSLLELLGPEQYADLGRTMDNLSGDRSAMVRVTLSVREQPVQFDVTAHRSDHMIICEFEPVAADSSFRFTTFYPPIRDSLLKMRDANTVAELCAVTVREVRALTGYDRVVAYRFDNDGPGEVIAEDVSDRWEPWLGLWFPASDVPPQARRLYLRHWIRTITDVADRSVALDPPLLPHTGRPLDLSGSVLRTVSGYHLEYLRNIGVASSMSVSLIRDDRLWGLIACHHGVPIRLSPELRAACEFLGTALSLQLMRIHEREQADELARARGILQRLSTAMAVDFPDSLTQGSTHLLDLLAADGVYVRVGEMTGTQGRVPAIEDIEAILRASAGGSEDQIGRSWTSICLGEAVPDLARIAPIASGALVLPVTAGGDVIVWFRGERHHEMRWAVDPHRPVVTSASGGRLSPRGSSMVWRETVKGCCTPWTAAEQEIVIDVWRAVVEVELRRTARLVEFNHELMRSNSDLDAFAHAVSHDLKEPLRGITNLATFLLEDNPDSLDQPSRRRLETIGNLSVRMDSLLNSLLRFAKLDHAGLNQVPVDTDAKLDEVVDLLAARFTEAQLEMRRPARLPWALCDPILLQEVLTNLLINAAKYAGEHPRWVEVGNTPVVGPVIAGAAPEAGDAVPTFYVKDNGIGVAAQFHEDIFKIFRRLHRGEEKGGGAGVGLAISRRIVERHGGRLWITSVPGQGSTFWFTLPPCPTGAA